MKELSIQDLQNVSGGQLWRELIKGLEIIGVALNLYKDVKDVGLILN